MTQECSEPLTLLHITPQVFQTELPAGSAGCLGVNNIWILLPATWMESLVFRCLVAWLKVALFLQRTVTAKECQSSFILNAILWMKDHKVIWKETQFRIWSLQFYAVIVKRDTMSLSFWNVKACWNVIVQNGKWEEGVFWDTDVLWIHRVVCGK